MTTERKFSVDVKPTQPGDIIRITVESIPPSKIQELKKKAKDLTKNDVLEEVRSIVRENLGAFKDLQGGNPLDKDNLFMDQGKRLVASIIAQRALGISQKKVRYAIKNLLMKTGSFSPIQATDLTGTITGFFKEVGEGLPRNK